MTNTTTRPASESTDLWLPRVLAGLQNSAIDRETIGRVQLAYQWRLLAHHASELGAEDITDTDDNGNYVVLEIVDLHDDSDREEWLDAVDDVAWYWGLSLVQWAGRWAIAYRPDIDADAEQERPKWRQQQDNARARVLAKASEWNLLTHAMRDARGQELADLICRRMQVGAETQQLVHDWILGDDVVLGSLRERCREFAGEHFAQDYVRDRLSEAEIFRGLAGAS